MTSFTVTGRVPAFMTPFLVFVATTLGLWCLISFVAVAGVALARAFRDLPFFVAANEAVSVAIVAGLVSFVAAPGVALAVSDEVSLRRGRATLDDACVTLEKPGHPPLRLPFAELDGFAVHRGYVRLHDATDQLAGMPLAIPTPTEADRDRVAEWLERHDVDRR